MCLLFKSILLIFRADWRERNIDERRTWIGCFLHASWLGLGPSTQACVLTWNQISNLSVDRTIPNQLSHTCQRSFFKKFFLMSL